MASAKSDNGLVNTNGAQSHHVNSNTSTTMSEYAKPGPSHKEKPEAIPKADRDGVSTVFAQFGQLLHASRRPLPTENGDGSYDTLTKTTGLKNDLKYIRMQDVKTVLEIARNKLKGEQLTDDKTMIMERTIQLVAGLPHKSRLREELTNTFLNELWSTLDHPPLLYMGEKFEYRMADGSWNNPMMPQIGAAGTSYSRSCRPGTIPMGALPDPELVFETIMKRTEYRKHPNNVSSMLWYWATVIIHDVFWTDPKDMSKNKASSYLDLAPLYGSNQEMQDSVRTFKDGMLKPDTFADQRLLGSPPGVCVIIIMFNRFHNHVAANLTAINEGGRFTKPSPDLSEEKAAAAWKKYDNDLFQTARLVTSGLYINITLVDYVRNIVNLNRSNTTWTLDPRAEMGRDAGTNAGSERGTGNTCSAEFNLCYRWHSCISAKDDKWLQDFFSRELKKNPLEVTPRDMVTGLVEYYGKIPKEPEKRAFGGFERKADGRFKDDDLVTCISDAIEDCAGAFGNRNVPEAMKAVEILGILQGRKWNIAGLNEFRKHFGLKPYEKFEDINSDPEVANSLRHLYEHPDFVELYPGLVAEEEKEPMVPGVGIAPTYTISRVILSDAVCLTRGDRFYTTDYHPRALTSWGYNEVAYDLNINQGCVFYKLFTRAFPNHFRGDSVYAHYPMVVPSETKMILTNLGRVQNFNFDRPSYTPPRTNVVSLGGAQHILDNQDNYRTMGSEGFSFLTEAGGSHFAHSTNSSFQDDQDEYVHSQLQAEDWASHVKTFYSQATDSLIKEKGYKLAGHNFVDIIRDVGNIGPVHFVSKLFNLPLKTGDNPRGIYSEHELYSALAVIFISVFHDTDPAKSFPLRQAAKAVGTQLGKLIEANVKGINGFGISSLFSSWTSKNDPLESYGPNLIKGLSKAGLNNYEIAWSRILPIASASVPGISEMFAQAVEYFLSPQGSSHLPEMYRIANLPPSAESDALMLGYCMEGVRLAGELGFCCEAGATDAIKEDDGNEVHVKTGDRIYVSSAGAAKDAERFPDPEKVNPRRPLDAYVHFWMGPHACLGRDVCQAALTGMFRSVFKLKNVRKAPGAQGQLRKISQPGGVYMYLREDGSYFPFPCTMKICYD